MGKVSDKDSYKNMRTATKSTKFFIDKQAPKKPKQKQSEGGAIYLFAISICGIKKYIHSDFK